MKGNINIRNGFEYFRYKFVPFNGGGRTGDIPQLPFDACGINEIYRLGGTVYSIQEQINELNYHNFNSAIVASCFPNPILNKITLFIENVDIESDEALVYEFYDALGRNVNALFDKSSSSYDREEITTLFNINTNLAKGWYNCVVRKNGIILCHISFNK